MTTIAARKQKIENIISKVAGASVELTIRGDKEFTFSTEEVNHKAASRIEKYFAGQAASIVVDHDDECGTVVYVDVK